MPITIDVLVDTNILLRTQFDKGIYTTNASRALVELRRRGSALATTLQNLAEFWNTSTRPEQANGYALSIEETQRRLEYCERSLTLLPETRESFAIWKRLLVDHKVRGKQVHDARLVSIMLAFGIPRILTFNAADFTRYHQVSAVSPDEFLEQPA
jgi:predicted nucleic acid-binding protein